MYLFRSIAPQTPTQAAVICRRHESLSPGSRSMSCISGYCRHCETLGTLLHTLQKTDSAVLNRYNRIMLPQAGLDVPGALHHIMIRGIDKTKFYSWMDIV
jgi:hypothetical protein